MNDWAAPFLAALAKGSSVSEAASAAGITSSSVYSRRKRDADFEAAYLDALEDSADVLEAEARRRAIDGVEEPVVYQGNLTPVWERDARGELVRQAVTVQQRNAAGEMVDAVEMRPVQAKNPDGSPKWLTIRKPSDALLALLLKGRRREVFGVERTELTGKDGGPILTDETARAARVQALLAAAARRRDKAGGAALDDLV